MQFPESWLRIFTNPDINTETLSNQLTMAGLEVEDVHTAAPAFSGVVVAEVLTVVPHTDSNKLKICTVSNGGAEPLQIVCGASNVVPGVKVPLAQVGAELPNNIKIGVGKLRGVDSFGMLCSATELGLPSDVDGLAILPADAPVGQCIRQYWNLDEAIFTIKLTPNKGDCLSVYGIAREVAAINRLPLKALTPATAFKIDISDTLPVEIEAPDLCGQFSGRIIRAINAKAATPLWMKQRLERAGQRSISALVDISNYVLLELGRPTHVFDLDRLSGGLTVRWAKSGESLKLLNGQTVALQSDMGVVADAQGAQSLAGIMGGDASAITLETQNIYLEGAFWYQDAIAGRSRRLKFSTDAGYRFERGVDYATIEAHLDYITALIVSICGGQVGPISTNVKQLPERKPVRLRLARCHKILGITIPAATVAEIFTALQSSYTQDGEDFIVTPPSYRFDIEREEDLIEEVARMYGFDNIPSNPPQMLGIMRARPERLHSTHAVRHHLAHLDYQEVVNYSFVDADWEKTCMGNANAIPLLNPIASHMTVMRSSLIAGLVANVQYNVNRKSPRVRLFEVGRVFAKNTEQQDADLEVAGVSQPHRIAGVAYGFAEPEQWSLKSRLVDFYDVKNDVLALLGDRNLLFVAEREHPAFHPGRCARIVKNGQIIGILGELHPQHVQNFELPHAPVLFELNADTVLQRNFPVVEPIAKQPSVTRDLAVWVPEALTAQTVIDTILQSVQQHPQANILQDAVVFDVWRDKNTTNTEKSFAIRLTLQDSTVTLDENRIEECVTVILQTLTNNHQARLRM